MKFFNNLETNNSVNVSKPLNTNDGNNINNESDTLYKVSIVFIALVVIIILTVSLIGMRVKKTEKKMYVYPKTTSKLVSEKVEVKIKSSKNTKCSKLATCTSMEEHKVTVDVNGNIYELDANKKKYEKIKGTKKYVYAAIENNRVRVGIARNYSIGEMLSLGANKVGSKFTNFLEGIREWLGSHTNWTK